MRCTQQVEPLAVRVDRRAVAERLVGDGVHLSEPGPQRHAGTRADGSRRRPAEQPALIGR